MHEQDDADVVLRRKFGEWYFKRYGRQPYLHNDRDRAIFEGWLGGKGLDDEASIDDPDRIDPDELPAVG